MSSHKGILFMESPPRVEIYHDVSPADLAGIERAVRRGLGDDARVYVVGVVRKGATK